MADFERNPALRTPSAALPEPLPHRRCYRNGLLIVLMGATIWTVALLVYEDIKRRSAESLGDFAEDQATLAQCLAQNLRERLATRPQEPTLPQEWLELLGSLRAFERTGERLVLLQLSPATPASFLTPTGELLLSVPLKEALRQGLSFVQLPREEAYRLGLPRRMAIAGLAPLVGRQGRSWSVAAVATAWRERDREQQESWRTLLAVLIAAGAVLTLGGIAMHWQRQEQRTQRALELGDALRKRDERLAQASRVATLGTLAMGITHELSTPLSIIAARAEQLLSRVPADDRAGRSARVILEQSERMSQIIRGMLGLVRGQNPEAEPLRPADVAQAAVALVEHRFTQSGIRLALDAPADLPRIIGDPRLLEHALVNLLLNAHDACTAGGHVELRVRVAAAAVLLCVIDDGAGISTADAERAMEPFFTTKPVGQGAGLGLAIAHEIVKSHRGSLHIAPRPEGGTCAAITLPLHPEDSYVPALGPAPEPAPEPAHPGGR